MITCVHRAYKYSYGSLFAIQFQWSNTICDTISGCGWLRVTSSCNWPIAFCTFMWFIGHSQEHMPLFIAFAYKHCGVWLAHRICASRKTNWWNGRSTSSTPVPGLRMECNIHVTVLSILAAVFYSYSCTCTNHTQYDISSTQLHENCLEFLINVVLRNLGQIREPVDLWTL